MQNNIEALIDASNDVIREAEMHNGIARDSTLQKKTLERLTSELEVVALWKSEVILEGNEDLANVALGLECVMQFLLNEIEMWLFLKDDEPDKGWECLIKAQRFVTDAVRSHVGFKHVASHAERLDMIERLVFPPQVFTSVGMIVQSRLCSICGKDYNECNHLRGYPYMGQICYTIITKIEEVDHIAFVENPANKLCRVTHFNVPGGVRNRMTWKVEPQSTEEHDQSKAGGLKAQGIIYSTDDRN